MNTDSEEAEILGGRIEAHKSNAPSFLRGLPTEICEPWAYERAAVAELSNCPGFQGSRHFCSEHEELWYKFPIFGPIKETSIIDHSVMLEPELWDG